MRRPFIPMLAAVLLFSGFAAAAATGRVVKVLPEFLDLQGRNTLSPSLFERDAYQAYLREHPAARSGLRFYLEYQAHHVETPLTLRVEMRGGTPGEPLQNAVLEKKLKSGHWFRTWTTLDLTGKNYQAFGELLAWRVTLWDGNRLLSEKKSFLW